MEPSRPKSYSLLPPSSLHVRNWKSGLFPIVCALHSAILLCELTGNVSAQQVKILPCKINSTIAYRVIKISVPWSFQDLIAENSLLISELTWLQTGSWIWGQPKLSYDLQVNCRQFLSLVLLICKNFHQATFRAVLLMKEILPNEAANCVVQLSSKITIAAKYLKLKQIV